MTALTWVLLAFSIIGLIFGFWQWMARRRTVQRLDNLMKQNCLRWRQNSLGSCAALLIRKK